MELKSQMLLTVNVILVRHKMSVRTPL